MKRDGKYRFSLQFPDTIEENRMVGELLERMGNRKSTVIVDAVREYLLHHPELQEENCKIEITVTQMETSENLENLVRQLVEERIALYQQEDSTTYQAGEDMQKEEMKKIEPSDSLEEDISQMLDNLNFFEASSVCVKDI